MQQCTTRRQRRSGPGGQHRNKVETAVFITHLPSGLTAEASERRSQAENLAVAQFRLRLRLAVELREEPAGGPSQLWLSRSAGGRLRVNPAHQDFPALLAEALDVLHAAAWEDASAAAALGITRTQLVGFLADAPVALALLNANRAQRCLPPLRG